MKAFIVLCFVLCPTSVAAQASVAETPKELTPPRHEPHYPEVGNLHNVDAVMFPHETPMLKNRKVVPENAVKAPDQGYQTPCQHGDIVRCSGVDLTKMEEVVVVNKTAQAFPPIKAWKPRTFGQTADVSSKSTPIKRSPKRRR